MNFEYKRVMYNDGIAQAVLDEHADWKLEGFDPWGYAIFSRLVPTGQAVRAES